MKKCYKIEHHYLHQEKNNVDLQRIIQMDSTYFPYPWSEASWEVLHGLYLLSLVTIDSDLKGFSLYKFEPADRSAHLLKILVLPDFRNMGLGKDFLKSSLDIFKEQGIVKFFLEVEDQNINAVKLYESLGFKKIHHHDHFFSDGKGAFIMTQED